MWTPCEISYFWWWFFPAFLMVLGRIWGGFGMILWPCSRNGSLGSMMPTTGCNRCTKPPRNIRSSRLLSVCRICWSDKIWCYFPDSTSISFFVFFFPPKKSLVSARIFPFQVDCPPQVGWVVVIHQVYVSLWGGTGPSARWSSASSRQICQAWGLGLIVFSWDLVVAEFYGLC